MIFPRESRNLSAISIALLFVCFLVRSDCVADPGKSFQEIRTALVAQHDQNGDGRLDESEREAMRELAKQGVRQNSRRRGGWSPPPEWLERYDVDGDGELSRMEQGAAFAGEQQRMTEKYDADGDGRLDSPEKETLKKDFEKGVFTGMERFIAMQIAGIERRGRRSRRGGGGFSETQQRWLDFDVDGDGKASVAELQAIRQSMQ